MSIYLMIAPVYWLPYLEPEILRPIKVAIFCLGSALCWSGRDKSSVNFVLRSFYGISLLFLLLITSTPGFILAAPGQFARTLLDYLLVLIMLWAAFGVASDVDRTARVLVFSAIGLALLSIPTVTSSLAGFPAWMPPAEYKLTSLAEAGFGAARTGWSNGLALYVPLLLLAILQPGRATWARGALFSLLLVILASQYWSGGRAGLSASALAMFLMLVIKPPSGRRRWSVPICVACVFMAGLMLVDTDTVVGGDSLAHLRLDRLQGNTTNSWGALDDFSAGRIELMQYAFEQFLDQPLGSGFGNATYLYGSDASSFREAEVHNLWIKLLVETGVPLVATLLLFVAVTLGEIGVSLKRLSILACNYEGYRMAYGLQVTYMTIVIQGLFLSMFEPNALIGSFQATAVWWVAAGAALRNASLVRADFKAAPESLRIRSKC